MIWGFQALSRTAGSPCRILFVAGLGKGPGNNGATDVDKHRLLSLSHPHQGHVDDQSLRVILGFLQPSCLPTWTGTAPSAWPTCATVCSTPATTWSPATSAARCFRRATTAAPSAARTSVTPCASTIPDEGRGMMGGGEGWWFLSNGAQGVKSDDQEKKKKTFSFVSQGLRY